MTKQGYRALLRRNIGDETPHRCGRRNRLKIASRAGRSRGRCDNIGPLESAQTFPGGKSAAAVDVGSVLYSDHVHDPCLVVDAVDDAVGAAAGREIASELSAERLSYPPGFE